MLIFILLAIAIIVIRLFYGKLRKQKQAAGLGGWVRTQDLDGKSSKVYRNYEAGISAKPDIVEGNKVTEYKSAAIGDRARRSDIIQLTAEMLATKAKKGELRYGNDKRFQFTKDTPIIKSSMKRIAWISEQMKWHLGTRTAPPGAPKPSKCAKCRYQEDCTSGKKSDKKAA